MTTIEDLVRRGAVQRVQVDTTSVRRLLEDADRHMKTATAAMKSGDLAGSFQLAYDAARKSLTALALNRGLRTRGEGAHATLIEVIEIDFSGAPGVEVVGKLDRLRRTRNRSQYSGHSFNESEVANGLETASDIVRWVKAQGSLAHP